TVPAIFLRSDPFGMGTQPASKLTFEDLCVWLLCNLLISIFRLPIPKLEDTIERYLAAQRPLLNDEQYRATEKIAREFETGEGKILHRDLLEHDRINKYTSYISGQGFDRHLFALKYLVQRRGGRIPDIFSDPAYKYINHIIISTSTLGSPAVYFGGFGPVVPDGFGVAYNVFDDWVGCLITSYLENDLEELIGNIEYTLNDIFDVLEGRSLS
uniref:Choline/carnitine acyltransferase domain-containing protein n=1 Tax=Salvator merianae TaxID=96440 RepID=A0A8D0BL70_SALMN